MVLQKSFMMILMPSPPPLAGDHHPSPPLLHSINTKLLTKRHRITLPQNINRLHQSKNLTGPLNSGSPFDSRVVFQRLQNNNLYQWNSIISGYARNSLWYDSMHTFCLFLETEHVPDNFTLPCVIKACVGSFDLGFGRVVQGIAVKTGLILDVFVSNSLVAMYGKLGFVEDAVKVFELMPQRNLVTWNSLISGFSDNAFLRKSIDLFGEFMVDEDGLIPDVATLVTLLPVCAAERDVSMGKLIHSLAVKLGLYRDLMVQNALMDMYLKCGYLLEARIIFDKNRNKNVVSWNSIIRGYSGEGEVDKTFELLHEMQTGSNGRHYVQLRMFLTA